MSATLDRFRTPLKRVRGLGSAKGGVHHWWWQRVTAVALVPLSLWFWWFCAAHAGADAAQWRAAVGDPLSAVLLISLLVCLFHHGQLGVQVIVEDYVHVRWLELSLIVATKFLAFAGAVGGSLAVVRIALGA